MTETTRNTAETATRPDRYAVDAVAFFKALIGAPLIVAALGFWALGIPVFAVVFGGPAYLAFGTPILLIYLYIRSGTPGDIALLAFFVMAALLLARLVLSAVAPLGNSAITRDIDTAFNLGLWGLLFAPLWGFAFGKLYNRWRSPASRRPLPPLA